MNAVATAAPNPGSIFADHPLVMGTGCLFQVFIFGMTVYAIVHYFVRLRYSLKTRRLGAIFLAASLCAQVYALIMLFGGPLAQGQGPMAQNPQTRPFVIVGMVLGAGVGIVFAMAQGLAITAAGAYFSARLRQPHFPHLRSLFHAARRKLPRASGFPWVLTLAMGAAFVGYSALLFFLVPAQISPIARKSAQSLEGFLLNTESALPLAVLVSLIAVTEEVVFRLFLQTQFEYWFRRYARAPLIAILLTSTIWTLGHAAALEPAWVKFAQIFPMGLALGWMRRKHGVEPCIVAHVLLNLGAVYLMQGLVQP